MRRLLLASAVIAAAAGSTACGDEPSGAELFGNGSRPGTPGESGGRPGIGGGLVAGSQVGGAPSPSFGGTAGTDGPGGLGTGGGESVAGADGEGSGGSAVSGGAGGASAGGPSASGSSAGGAASGGSFAGSSVGGALVAGSGGNAGAGSDGVGGKGDVRACAELRTKADAYLQEAQACKPSNQSACSGLVSDECGCPVVVDDRDSELTERYVAVIEQLRKRCTVACLALVCRDVDGGRCTSMGPGEPRCVARGSLSARPGSL